MSMKRIVAAVLCWALCAGPASAAGFSDWAVMIVAGDNHAHSGAMSDVFDNARRDLAKAFAGIGFSRANIVQFAVTPSADAQPTQTTAIAHSLWDLSSRAPGGCLIYFTSHGSPDGIVSYDQILAPGKFATIVNNACGSKPSVIVMSACYSGIFVPALEGPNRIILTAAAADRTSFGCGEADHYTFFDTCFLQSLPDSGDFPGLAQATTACVTRREQAEHAIPPSEPQLSIGKNVMFTLRWK
jgi:hypothetical protein